jgi:hypothetical protein
VQLETSGQKHLKLFSDIISQVVEQNALIELIRKGRRRQIRNLLIQQASFSAALALGGAILLLVLGTQILNWYWLVLLFAVSLGAGIYRGRNKILTDYRVAQSIDARLGLHDALSTAHYFNQNPDRVTSSDEFIEDQKQVAEDLARSADVRSGLPFVRPRTLYVNAVLAVAVFAMFGLRYGINRSLDLRSSLIHINFDAFFGSREIAKADRPRGKNPFEDRHRDKGVAVQPWEDQPADAQPPPDPGSEKADQPDTSNPDETLDIATKNKSDDKAKDQLGDDLVNAPDKQQQKSSDANPKDGDQKGSPDAGSKSGKQDQNAQQKNGDSNSGENSSLAEKMRDTIANLLAKLKSQPKNGEGKQGDSSQQKGQQQASQQQNQNKSNSKGSSGDQQSQNNANSQSQGDKQSQNGSQQGSESKSEASNADQNSQNGKSGAGKQDGEKAVREAAELAAMGKISEIIGKRSANVTGEVMVEVSSGKQQLRTQYSGRTAEHTEAGGEINRDEVPLAYQQYVQQYFEDIRKQPAAKAKPAAKTKAVSH